MINTTTNSHNMRLQASSIQAKLAWAEGQLHAAQVRVDALRADFAVVAAAIAKADKRPRQRYSRAL